MRRKRPGKQKQCKNVTILPPPLTTKAQESSAAEQKPKAAPQQSTILCPTEQRWLSSASRHCSSQQQGGPWSSLSCMRSLSPAAGKQLLHTDCCEAGQGPCSSPSPNPCFTHRFGIHQFDPFSLKASQIKLIS